MNVYVRKNTSYHLPIIYILKIIEKNRNVNFTIHDNSENADIIWDHENINSEVIAIDFFNSIKDNNASLKHNEVFFTSPHVIDKNGMVDKFASIFYMINSLQEFNAEQKDLDDLGRFKYSSSYQYRFNNINENLVEILIDEFCNEHSINVHKDDSVFFISHDIDKLYGSFFEDGFWALKNMKIKTMLNIILSEISKDYHWKNIDKIIKINDIHDLKSTFFWLVNKGKSKNSIENADYNIDDEEDLIKLVNESNNVNGLHKSSFNMSIDQELRKGKLLNKYNRYHYLKFSPQTDYKKISDSSLIFDSSLGFAEMCGFRNSYGKSFQPFDIRNQKPYDFVETPLHLMDRTFHKYMNVEVDNIGNTIIKIYEQNPKNCDISLLWHNNNFTDFKYSSFMNEYKKVAGFIYESKIKCVCPKELVKLNVIDW